MPEFFWLSMEAGVKLGAVWWGFTALAYIADYFNPEPESEQDLPLKPPMLLEPFFWIYPKLFGQKLESAIRARPLPSGGVEYDFDNSTEPLEIGNRIYVPNLK